MKQYLFDIIRIKNRYSRSVNLERDILSSESIENYVITAKSSELLKRFFAIYQSGSSVKAWTITGAYGSGKSAFALFLTALASTKSSPFRQKADKILFDQSGMTNPIDKAGFIIAFATAQREAIHQTVLRAIKNAINRSALTSFLNDFKKIEQSINTADYRNDKLISLIENIILQTGQPLLIVIDELGKNFEYTAYHKNEDLYLLQQIAEIANSQNSQKLFFIGLLHQSVSDYAFALTQSQRKEWEKVQGRFEQIIFQDSIDSIFHLIANSVIHTQDIDYFEIASKWHKILNQQQNLRSITPDDIVSIYPLHPFSAIVLPVLCNRYAQNDRTLFTFLASNEPYSLTTFLTESEFKKKKHKLLKIHRIYDYFVETSFLNTNRLSNAKWTEIHSRITDASNLNEDLVSLLKTIGLLNILFTTGLLKASKHNVLLSMCDAPDDKKTMQYYDSLLNELINRGFITYRSKIDEFRVWEGSDFDIEQALSSQIQSINPNVAQSLNEHFPLSPLMANKHSYQSGTLRFFERVYVDKENTNDLFVVSDDYDGRICYVIDNFGFDTVKANQKSQKPILYIIGKEVEALIESAKELTALRQIYQSTLQIQQDAVARKELNHRIFQSKKILSNCIHLAFYSNSTLIYENQTYNLLNDKTLDDIISSACNKYYCKGIVLQNELINRNTLTSQISKARNEIISALINKQHLENLGFTGYGPEVTIYKSLLYKTGIHVTINNIWTISKPKEDSGIFSVWQKIEDYLLSATTSKKALDALYNELQNPPFGVRRGVIPILITSVLVYHSDYLCIYYDDIYLPILDENYAQILCHQPQRFSVKYISGVTDKQDLLVSIQSEFSKSAFTKDKPLRNPTLLSIINYLISTIKALPQCTIHTKTLSHQAHLVIKSITEAKEPDNLLFETLPQIFDVYPLNPQNLNQFIDRLKSTIKEMISYYPLLVEDCKRLMCDTFNIKEADLSTLRMFLSKRALLIKDIVIEQALRSFIIAILDDTTSDAVWLQSLIMLIANKPIEVWSDEDKSKFEANLSLLTKRFRYFEALAADLISIKDKDEYIAYRINIANSEGKEINDTLFLDKTRLENLKAEAEKNFKNGLFSNLNDDEKRIVATYLLELAFAEKRGQR